MRRAAARRPLRRRTHSPASLHGCAFTSVGKRAANSATVATARRSYRLAIRLRLARENGSARRSDCFACRSPVRKRTGTQTSIGFDLRPRAIDRQGTLSYREAVANHPSTEVSAASHPLADRLRILLRLALGAGWVTAIGIGIAVPEPSALWYLSSVLGVLTLLTLAGPAMARCRWLSARMPTNLALLICSLFFAAVV